MVDDADHSTMIHENLQQGPDASDVPRGHRSPEGAITDSGGMFSSPQRLSADRVLAARAAAAGMAASAVRIGYVAAAHARRHPTVAQLGLGSASSSGSLPSHGVAAAAVRAAAAHASWAGPEDTRCDESPRKLPEAPDSLEDSSKESEMSSEVTSTCERNSDAESQPAHPEAIPSLAHAEPTPNQAEEDREKSPPAHPEAFDQDATPDVLAAGQDSAAEEVDVDVVVQKTFISLKPRRQVLPHTASAPGYLDTCLGILGEAGSVRQRRHRSSRRSRRRRGGTGQAAAANSAELH